MGLLRNLKDALLGAQRPTEAGTVAAAAAHRGQQLAAAEGGTETPPPVSRREVLDDLLGCLIDLSNDALSREEVDSSAQLLDSGYVDSLKTAELLLFIERKYGVAVSEVDLIGALSSLDALVDHVAEQWPRQRAFSRPVG